MLVYQRVFTGQLFIIRWVVTCQKTLEVNAKAKLRLLNSDQKKNAKTFKYIQSTQVTF